MAKDGHTGDGTLERFSHYQYAPSRSLTQQSHPIFALSNGYNVNGVHLNNNHSTTMPAADC